MRAMQFVAKGTSDRVGKVASFVDPGRAVVLWAREGDGPVTTTVERVTDLRVLDPVAYPGDDARFCDAAERPPAPYTVDVSIDIGVPVAGGVVVDVLMVESGTVDRQSCDTAWCRVRGPYGLVDVLVRRYRP